MGDVASSRVVLDIEADRQPITGRISIEGLPDRAFAGWLELMSIIERSSHLQEPERLSAPPRR